MKQEDINRIKVAFNNWAEAHDKPNYPIISVGNKLLSPKEFANELEQETGVVDSFMKAIEHHISSGERSIDEIVKMIIPSKRSGNNSKH